MANKTAQSFIFRYRTVFMLAAVMLLLPPLSLILQVASGDANFCGKWCPRMFFVWREGMSIQQYLLGWLRSGWGVALVVGILLTTLWRGRFWCSHLCPIGATTELGSRIFPPKMKLPFNVIPAAPVRYGYLAVYVLAPALGLGSLCCNYCNFATVPRLFGAAFAGPADIAYFLRTAGWINLALILGLGIFSRGGRAYCNLLCPVGALDALVNSCGHRIGRRYQIRSRHCTACNDCVATCPTWAINADSGQHRIDPLSCLSCGNCQQRCPEDAIEYDRRLAEREQ